MEIFRIFVGICVLIYCDGAQQCKYEECNSKRDKRPVTCVVEDILEDGKIVSIEIVEEKKKNKCTESENYGFTSKSIWVSDKCSAEFKVCFIKDIDDDFSTTTVKITSTRNTSKRSTRFPGYFSKTTQGRIQTSTRATRETTDKVKYATPTYPTNSTHGNRTSQVDKILTAEFVTNEYLNPHLKASDRLSEHKIIAHDKQVKGILGGVVGGLIFLLLVLILCVVILRRFSCFNKRKYDQHYNNNGHRNVTSTDSQVTTVTNGDNDEYDTLGIYSEGRNHQYDEFSQVRFDQPHSYMTVYDSLEPPKLPPYNNRPTDLGNNARVHVKQTQISKKEMKIGDYIDLSSTDDGSDRSKILKVSTKNKYKSDDFCETKDLNATNYELAKPISNTTSYEPQQYELAKPADSEKEAPNCVSNSDSACNADTYNIAGESYNKCAKSENNLYSHSEDVYYVTPQQYGGPRKADHANYELCREKRTSDDYDLFQKKINV